MLIFCCRDNIVTKHRLVEIGFASQALQILFSGSGVQSRTQCLKHSSKQTPNGPETGSELKLLRLLY